MWVVSHVTNRNKWNNTVELIECTYEEVGYCCMTCLHVQSILYVCTLLIQHALGRLGDKAMKDCAAVLWQLSEILTHFDKKFRSSDTAH
jgi:hypothetical protein